MPDLPDLADSPYVDRVNRAIDHVTRNIAEPLRLEEIAKVAGFSPFHFHRVFKSTTGETLNEFTKRVRLERALYLLSHREGATLTEIALACGFSSSSDFSRSFRASYGVPPSAFDLESFRKARREQMMATLGPVLDDDNRVSKLPMNSNPDDFDVTLRELPSRRVAYLRVHRPYEGDGVVRAAERLIGWAKERQMEGGQWLGYQWDDPEIVPLEKCRYDVGLEVPESATVGDGVSVTTFDAMTVAELEIKGPLELEVRAIDWMFGTWLPASGMAPDHQPAFEAWNGLPFAHGMEHFELRMQLPVVRLV